MKDSAVLAAALSREESALRETLPTCEPSPRRRREVSRVVLHEVAPQFVITRTITRRRRGSGTDRTEDTGNRESATRR